MRLGKLVGLLDKWWPGSLKRIKPGHTVPFFALAVLALFLLPAAVPPPINSITDSISDGSDEQLVAVAPTEDLETVVPSDDGDEFLATPLATSIPTKSNVSLVGPSRVSARFTAPILMYHYIRVNPDPQDTLGAGLSVSPGDFDRQMRYLVDNGYQVVGLDELAEMLRQGRSVSPRTVVLTFDDGYMDFRQEAYPVLKKYGLKATSFIITDFVGRNGYLTWAAIQEMAGSSLITFGAHTLNHPDLTVVALREAERQIKESKRILEAQLGKKITLFAYPSGKYNDSVARVVEDAGYLAAVSTRYGNVHELGDMYRLKRIRIDGRDSLATFAGRLQYIEGVGSPSVAAPPSPITSTSVLTKTPQAARTPPPSLQTPRPSGQPGATPQSRPTATQNPIVPVPNLVGMTEAMARAKLNDSGLTVGYINYQQASDVEPESKAYFLSIAVGSVVSQQPPANSTTKRGDKVNLAVRKQ